MATPAPEFQHHDTSLQGLSDSKLASAAPPWPISPDTEDPQNVAADTTANELHPQHTEHAASPDLPSLENAAAHFPSFSPSVSPGAEEFPLGSHDVGVASEGAESTALPQTSSPHHIPAQKQSALLVANLTEPGVAKFEAGMSTSSQDGADAVPAGDNGAGTMTSATPERDPFESPDPALQLKASEGPNPASQTPQLSTDTGIGEVPVPATGKAAISSSEERQVEPSQGIEDGALRDRQSSLNRVQTEMSLLQAEEEREQDSGRSLADLTARWFVLLQAAV